LPEPASDTYDSAKTFLELMFKPKKARRWVKRLKRAGVSEYAAKDILRASAIPIATVRAFDWKKQLDQIHQGNPLSPILLLRQNDGGPLVMPMASTACARFSRSTRKSVCLAKSADDHRRCAIWLPRLMPKAGPGSVRPVRYGESAKLMMPAGRPSNCGAFIATHGTLIIRGYLERNV